MKLSLYILFLLLISTTSQVFAAVSDGSGLWADSVISVSQGNTKQGSAVPAARSDASSSLGIAEENDAEGTFFSLGFGGLIVLRFENGISNGVFVVETTHSEPYYPNELAKVEISSNGTDWFEAGNVSQDGSVEQPESVRCANFVRITDISNPEDFSDETADAYDVDGVRATEGEVCQNQSEPTPSPTVGPTPTPSTSSSNNSNSSNNPSNNPASCSVTKPGTPSLTATRTSATTVQLSWNNVSDATHYAISYGLNSKNYEYGVANTGNTNNFTIGGLAANTNYYFIVRAVNNCLPGDASNEVNVGVGQVLGLTTDGIGGSSIASRSKVLGLSTDSLAATGSSSNYLSILSGIFTTLSVYWLGKKYVNQV